MRGACVLLGMALVSGSACAAPATEDAGVAAVFPAEPPRAPLREGAGPGRAIAAADTRRYLRLTVTVDDGKVARIRAAEHEGEVAFQDRLTSGTYYEVKTEDGTVLAVEAIRHWSEPDRGSARDRAEHSELRRSSARFDVRIPDLSADEFIALRARIAVFRVDPPQVRIAWEDYRRWQDGAHLTPVLEIPSAEASTGILASVRRRPADPAVIGRISRVDAGVLHLRRSDGREVEFPIPDQALGHVRAHDLVKVTGTPDGVVIRRLGIAGGPQAVGTPPKP